MASENGVSRILGPGLPTDTDWLDVKWVLGLFDLSRNGAEFCEFQSWAREAAGGTPSALKMKSPVTPRLAVVGFGAYGVSKLLGTSLPTRENWLDDHWLQALFGLSARGVKFGAFRSWCQNVALGLPSIPDRRGLVEVLPSLLLGEEALKFKTSELALYVAGLDRTRFYEREYLKEIKAHLEMHRLLYWNRLDVTITIQARLGSAEANGVPQRIRDFYNTNLLVHGSTCTVVDEGSNCKPWVMGCGSSTGEHGSKKAARMIAIIREHIDPSFDPEDYGPPSPTTGKRKRQGLFEFWKTKNTS